MLAGNQRSACCPADGEPRPAVLARSLTRLPGDYLDLRDRGWRSDVTDRPGTPARATPQPLACAGPTSGYARGAGGRGYGPRPGEAVLAA